MARNVRLWFWLLAMDALHAAGAWRSGNRRRWALYLFAVGQASDCVDWRTP